ncbi:hypothetical protein C8F04DRAFT_1293811 [Mycena alexandri]|uniref:Uncharacterized protein n=1 Tax=Mycena alexandri TaxID=1745969 RepID=A0AAD6SHH2_9AGAR|nr:hypothetical protein C8F04DRAFT_1293811 [Mycena alexandri]
MMTVTPSHLPTSRIRIDRTERLPEHNHNSNALAPIAEVQPGAPSHLPTSRIRIDRTERLPEHNHNSNALAPIAEVQPGAPSHLPTSRIRIDRTERLPEHNHNSPQAPNDDGDPSHLPTSRIRIDQTERLPEHNHNNNALAPIAEVQPDHIHEQNTENEELGPEFNPYAPAYGQIDPAALQEWLRATDYLEAGSSNEAQSDYVTAAYGSPTTSTSTRYPLTTLSHGNSPPDFTELGHHTDDDNTHSAANPLPLSIPFSANSGPPSASGLTPPTLRPGNSSLAAMRSQNNHAAVFVGFPGAARTERNLFARNVTLPASSPISLHTIIRSLRDSGSGAGTAVDMLCAHLDTAPCTVAWSKRYVEVDDEATYTSPLLGYTRVGALIDHLQVAISTPISPADSDETSRTVLSMNELPPALRLYVVYIISAPRPSPPQNMPNVVPNPAVENLGLPPTRASSSSRSGSRAPGPSASSLGSVSLPRLLRASTFLDLYYLAIGFELSTLLTRGFGAGYIQVRQTLKVESVARRIKVEHPTCSVSVQDISVWAGVNPATYANNLTVAKNARATLQYLSYFSTTPGPSLQSSEDRERDQKLQGFLAQLFSTTDLGEHWRRNVDGLEAGGAKVQLVKTRIERFSRLITVYKEEVFETC